MPSRTEGSGLTALEALSAGLPVLVNANSGFGEALGEVAFGSQYVIESEDAEVWAAEIKKVWTKSRKIRLQESKTVRYSYVTKYSWEEQCRDLVEKMRFIVNERSRSWTTILEVVEEHPDADILGAVNQPHLPQPAIEERNVSRTSEDDTMTLSRRNTNRSGKRNIQSESTSDQGADKEGPSSSKKESRSISGTIPKLDPAGPRVTIPEEVEHQPDADLPGAVYQLQLTNQPQPSEGGNVSKTNKEGAVPLSTGTAKRSGKRKSQSDSDQGVHEEGTSPTKKEPPNISGTIPKLATLIRLIIEAQDLNDEQQRRVHEFLALHTQAYVESRNFSAAELELVGGFIEHVEKVYEVALMSANVGSLEIVLHCPTLKRLEHLWSDYLSGHLNEVAEKFLITDEIKRMLKLETIRLKTTIEEENYLNCRKALMEMSEAAGDADFPSQQTASDEGASTRKTDTSSDFEGEKERDASWMVRAETAKASRSALHKASIRGQSETVKMFLGRGEYVDQRDQFSLTPLHLACWYGQESVVRLLLEHGANVNAVDRFQRTPLQKAERHNHQSIVKLLLKNNASPIYQQPLSLKSLSRKAFLQVDRRSGFNLLQAAFFEGDYNIVWKVQALVDDYVKEMNFETTSSDAKLFPGKTAVDILLSLDTKKRGHDDIDKLYQEAVEKYSTMTELHRCARSDDAEKAVELVVNDGVDINIPALCNRTPLLWANSSSSSVLIKTLIDLGADVNVQRTDDKVAPLYLAACWNNYMATHLLLEHGADKEIETIDGESPLHISVSVGLFEVSLLLIEAGCNINLRNKIHQTPLYFAVKNKHEQLTKLLLDCNADVSMGYKQNSDERIYTVRGKDRGKPAWHYVLVERHLLGLFLKRTNGGSLDVADFGRVLNSGWGKDPPEKTSDKIRKDYDIFKEITDVTLLHMASSNNSTEIIYLLVKYGADVNALDSEGFSPLHVAAIHGNMQVVKKLVDLKADVSQATADGRDAADMARLNEETEIEEYLRSKVASSHRTERKEVEQDVTYADIRRLQLQSTSEEYLRSKVDSSHITEGKEVEQDVT